MSAISTAVPEELGPNKSVPNEVVERRFYPRVSPPVLTSMGVAGTAGKLLDVSENGLAISTENEVAPNTVWRITIPLDGLEKPIEVTARVVWATEPENRVGIQFLNLSENGREQIRKWQARETSSDGNGVRSVAEKPTARWIQQNELLASLAATPIVADPVVMNPAAAKVEDGDRGHEEVAADSKLFPAVPINGANAPSPIDSSDETARALPPRTGEASSQLAVVAIIALIAATLFFGIGALFLNSWLKSSLEVDRARMKPSASRPTSHRSPSFATAGVNEKQSAGDYRDNIPDRGQGTSAAGNLSAEEVRTLPSYVGKNTGSNNFRTGGQKTQPLANSQKVNAPAPNTATTPAISSTTTDLSGPNGPKISTYQQTNSTITTDSHNVGASAKPAAQPPNMVRSSGTRQEPPAEQTRQETRNSVSSADRTELATADNSRKENIPAAIFPSASSTPTPASDSTVFERRETRLTIPKNNSSPILHVSGERVMESSAARIHIQRAIFVPDEQRRWWWPLGKKKDKEVLLGELISHADPQTTRLPLRGSKTVRVRAIVGRNGSVVDLKPVSGGVELMPAVMRAVRQWHYRPTYVDGIRVETEANISFEFHPLANSASR